jgi:hypothetical protein
VRVRVTNIHHVALVVSRLLTLVDNGYISPMAISDFYTFLSLVMGLLLSFRISFGTWLRSPVSLSAFLWW